MKKIERYELCATNGRSPEELVVETYVADKLNEITDRLNQSVSQPERSETDRIRGEFDEKMRNARREVENDTEEGVAKRLTKRRERKMEEMLNIDVFGNRLDNTEEWIEKLNQIFPITHFDYCDINDIGCCTCPAEDNRKELILFIKQLISERSFSKWELKCLSEFLQDHFIPKPDYDNLVEKVDRLLSSER